MALSIDVSQPFRYPSELERLADGVHNADKNDETGWIEWKSALDLTSPNGVKHIARQILGFANRDPQVAVSWAGGYAYLIVGVSPGELKGVQPVDPERLVSQIQPYVGAEIAWRPEYIKISNTDVLIIVVDPPRQGDSIHSLRKEMEGFKAGIIFTRRPGQTAQANPDEIAMLQRRLLARGDQIDLEIKLASPTIEAQPHFNTIIDNWAEDQRSLLLEEAGKPPPPDGLGVNTVGGFRLAPWSSEAQAKYESRIATYLEQSFDVQLRRCVRRFFSHSAAKIRPVITNHTDRNFSDVLVTLTIDGQVVRAYYSSLMKIVTDNEPTLPRRPKFGYQEDHPLNLSQIYHQPIKAIYRLPSFPDSITYGWAASEVAGKGAIAYNTFNLRPHETYELPGVPLLIAAEPLTPISIEWGATATNANGTACGTLIATVSSSTFSSDWIDER